MMPQNPLSIMKVKFVLTAICSCSIAASGTESVTPERFNCTEADLYLKKKVDDAVFDKTVPHWGPVPVANRAGLGTSQHEWGWAIDWVRVGNNRQVKWDRDGAYDIGRQLAMKYGLTDIKGESTQIQDGHCSNYIYLPKSECGQSVTNSEGAGAGVCQSVEMKPEDLAEHLEGVLKGHEQAYIAAAAKHGMDPMLLVAISILETGHGSSRAVRSYNNVGGMMDEHSRGMRGFLKFGSIDEGIEVMAKNLKEKYFDEGLDTIKKIGAKYAPVGGNVTNDPHHGNARWSGDVTNIYRKLRGKGFLQTPERLVSNHLQSGEM